jgi:flagellar hook protein FlgE
MSFYTSLSGLQASQTDMSTISNNLANSATAGFKRSKTQFADVMASSVTVSPNHMIGSGVAVKDTSQQFSEGNIIQSQSSLDLAITGDGFFAVKPQVDGSAVNYTRNGGFLVDANGYVTDAQGGHLQIYPADGSGAVVASGADSLISLRLPETSGVPIATQNVTLDINFNAAAAVPSASPDFDASNPYAFDRFDPATYNQSTQTTVYDANGNAQTMNSYYVRDGEPDGSGNTTWSVYSFVGDQQLTTGGGSASPIQLTFDSTGTMTAPSSPTQYDTFTPAGSTTAQSLALDFAGSTQLTTPFNVNSRAQDGSSVGQLSGVTVDDTGIVKASFSNGDSKILGKVAIANFNNPTGLRQMGHGYWQATGLSGNVKYGQAGDNGFGSLMSGAIEGSNVDITEELVDLIAAQQNFQANAKALDTANQVSQTIFNIR